MEDNDVGDEEEDGDVIGDEEGVVKVRRLEV